MQHDVKKLLSLFVVQTLPSLISYSHSIVKFVFHTTASIGLDAAPTERRLPMDPRGMAVIKTNYVKMVRSDAVQTIARLLKGQKSKAVLNAPKR